MRGRHSRKAPKFRVARGLMAGALILGVGMCLTMVWGTSYLIPGILVGCAGLLICVLNAALRLVKTA